MCSHSTRWIVVCLLLRSWPPINGFSQRDAPTAVELEVRVVSVQMLEPSLSFGLMWMGAAMHLAVQRANEKYALRGLRFVLRPVKDMYSQTCSMVNANGIPLLTGFYYRNNLDQYTPHICNIYFTNTCVDYVQQLYLSKEWNALFLINGMGPQLSLPLLLPPPHMLSLAGSAEGLTRTLWNVLNFFGWSHVTFFLDTRATTNLYSAICDAAKVLALQDSRTSSSTIATYPFQGNDNASIAHILLRAKANSRVFILGASASVAYLIMMLNLTWNLIYVILHESDNTDYERHLNGELRQLAHDLYNITYEPGVQPLSNYATRSVYRSFELISGVLADHLDEYRNLTPAQRAVFCSGDHLASLFNNHTFKLPDADVRVDGSGMSSMDVDIWMFNPQTRNMSIFAVYRSVSGAFELRNTSVLVWPTGSLPLDVPLCGFSGDEGPCGMAMMLLTASCAALIGVRKRARRNGYWWLISANELDARLFLGGAEVTNPVLWRRRTVWLTTVDIQGRPNPHLLAQIVPDATHPNVNALLGIAILPHRVFLLAGYCKRGSLLTLLELTKLDEDFQLAMARDLAQGLSYLHGTIGRPHGGLSADCCLIDDRFTLRIGQFGFATIRHALLSTKDVNAIDCTDTLTLSADVPAVGQIFLLIIHQSTNKIPSTLAETLAEDEDVCDAMDCDIKRRLAVLASRCHHSNTILRPTAKQLKTAIGRLHVSGQPVSRNIVDSIIRRFETYTLTLNDAVRLKTEELQSERKKCDDLLRELLPRSVVDQLRNGEAMVAEYFSSVSICFFDLDDFVNWVSCVPPELVIDTVTSVFSAFDGAIVAMNVYKVETVRDSYMTATGIPHRGDNQHAVEICRMAIKLMKVFDDSSSDVVALRLRCGIHSGACAAGVIGIRVPRYCLFGDTVNVAARMNSHGQGGRIHLSQASHNLIADSNHGHRFTLQERGLLSVKGKGDMRTFWLLP
ncbi:atrial natriuretic peptide receptor 1-like [Paramacrobiotus metropolitanus]|uniref:atrial natriuretic peptide receptor 1-like n=1 Tax=Paramacrobiotus metropolitanus TaxID=2943436 RepID=UPI0024460CDA|nr:atrial natriuretic peptide receptor 1-like [Paramacrobiotus metropolitanus]